MHARRPGPKTRGLLVFLYILRLRRRMSQPEKVSCCVYEVDLDFMKQAAFNKVTQYAVGVVLYFMRMTWDICVLWWTDRPTNICVWPIEELTGQKWKERQLKCGTSSWSDLQISLQFINLQGCYRLQHSRFFSKIVTRCKVPLVVAQSADRPASLTCPQGVWGERIWGVRTVFFGVSLQSKAPFWHWLESSPSKTVLQSRAALL